MSWGTMNKIFIVTEAYCIYFFKIFFLQCSLTTICAERSPEAGHFLYLLRPVQQLKLKKLGPFVYALIVKNKTDFM